MEQQKQTELTPCPPSEWELDYWKTWEDQLGMTQKEILEDQWRVQKQQNHEDNLDRLHGVYYHGVYFHHGVAQKE